MPRARTTAHFRIGAAAPLLAALVATSCASERPEHARFPDVGPSSGASFAEAAGFAHQLVWGDGPKERERRAGQLERLRATGARWVRTDFTWHRLERRPGEWDFSGLDAVVRDAHAAGAQILAVACYGNPIYPSEAGAPTSGTTDLPLDHPPEVNYPPSDPDHFAHYVEEVVRRYGERVKHWEIWNEQNLGYRFWRPETSGAEYVRYLRAAVAAGKAACSDCTFVVGGLSMPQPIPRLSLYETGPVFLDAMYGAAPDLASFVDAVGFHPYQMPKDAPEHETAPFEERFQGSLETQTRAVRAVTERHGRALPLFITENGWPTNPGIPTSDDEIGRIFGLDRKVIQFGRALLGEEDFAKVLETIRGVPEETQARYLVRSLLIGAAEGVPVNLLYGLDDYDIEPAINQESAFGVYRFDGSPKPAVAALATLLRRFGGYRFAKDVRSSIGLDDDHRVLAFRDGEKILLTAWRWRGGAGRLRLAALPGRATALDHRGHELTRAERETGVLDIALGEDPVYVEVVP